MKSLITFALLFMFFNLKAQERIDSAIPFEDNPAKKYSIYIPSNYDPNVPNELVLGLHPFNVNRWNAESWCDTLIDFAEMNDVLVICPDGDADGSLDDQVDTLFATAILDSMTNWYNVNEDRIFVVGFSIGAKVAYTYGLTYPEKFAGLMPIGSATSGGATFSHLKENAKDENVYIIHGDLDNVWLRYQDAIDTLVAGGACVESTLLANVNHTIDFPDRNEIMTEGLNYLRDHVCGSTALEDLDQTPEITITPNPISPNEGLKIIGVENANILKLQICSSAGEMIFSGEYSSDFKVPNLRQGVYILKIIADEKQYSHKIIIQ